MYRDLARAEDADIDKLKALLWPYVRETLSNNDHDNLRFRDWCDIEVTRISFLVYTPQMDTFYLTVKSDDSVLYSDGAQEYDVPIERDFFVRFP